MNTEKRLKQQMIEEKDIIKDYERQLKLAKEKIKQINSQQYSLKLVKMKKSISENIGGFVLAGLFLIGLKFLLPVLETTVGKIATTVAFFAASSAAVIIQEYENRQLNKERKENPYYNDFEGLSKKECTKKQQELDVEKRNELVNIESLEDCIKIERSELDSLIEMLAYLEKIKETVSGELEKIFLQYLDEKTEYEFIHFEPQPVEKVKIKSKVKQL